MLQTLTHKSLCGYIFPFLTSEYLKSGISEAQDKYIFSFIEYWLLHYFL